jgi:hypothetical protein
MVHVNTMDTAQLRVHVLMTGPVVDVNVSFFYVFFMTPSQEIEWSYICCVTGSNVTAVSTL